MPSSNRDNKPTGNSERDDFAQLQESLHGEGHDYVVGSPHLRHAELRERINTQIRNAVADVLRRQPECRVLEVGAGHGSFTDVVVDAKGAAVLTEMSKPSFDYLSRKFADVPEVTVLLDPDGNEPFRCDARFDLILLISVIHHIPDYIDTITRLCDEVLNEQGSILSFQDPLWFPRQSRWSRLTSSVLYLAWRLSQGEFRRGLQTRLRRTTGNFDESNPSDMVEYHAVRQGVDDQALYDLLAQRFERVDFDRYFSTQSPVFQKFGSKFLPDNTFGITGVGLKPKVET